MLDRRRTLLLPIIAFLAIPVIQSVAQARSFEIKRNNGLKVRAEEITSFNQPWAMAFLPNGKLLVTTKPGRMYLVTQQGKKTRIRGVPRVVYAGQGGLGDIVLHPKFKMNGHVYFSYAGNGSGGNAGAVVIRAKLNRTSAGLNLESKKRIWQQLPKTSGRGHYSHRLVFAPDGKLFITAGDRQELTPAQDMSMALGKIIRLNDDGSVPRDNPWQNSGELAKTYWSIGHRNMLGIAFDRSGRLWAHEMGPRHGDELNLILRGKNYGWPIVSNGNHYSGQRIPDHKTRPEFEKPKAYWVPAISPAGFIVYDGKLFPDWRGNGFLGGLSSRALVRVAFDGTKVREVERLSWGRRVREVEQGPAGAVWILEDGRGGRLLKLTPR